MTITTVRRLAADIFGVGKNKIRISPDGLKEAEGALTRADVQGLIDKGVITKAKFKGRASKKKTKRRGPGSKKGKTSEKKKRWMEKVRAQRKFLVMLLETGALGKEHKRTLYGKIKSGLFRNKRAMLLYLKDNKFVAEDYEPPKKEPKKKAKPVKPAKPKKIEEKGDVK